MKPVIYGIIRVVSDLVILLGLIVINSVLQNIEPYHWGYFPQDDSIKKPYKSSTIPSYVLYVVSSLLIVITIVIGEVSFGAKTLKTTRRKIPVILYPIYDSLIVAFFGYFATISLTDVGKVAFGRLRPNFIDACQPQNLVNTTLGFVKEFSCVNSNSRPLRKSFPSGHTSVAIYSAAFLCLYVQLRFARYRVFPGVRIICQMIFIALGLVVGYSRIIDNKHHWSDVLMGGILGFLLAFSTLFYLPFSGDGTGSLPVFRDGDDTNDG
uniref:Phosphatidic acid phosphatase type 2/haloperoxidase domain-containing protein n=2 Tax=Trichobilharzia regenti TaxID=157069 RepID=A0AA85J5P5_TRIRE|nr:unnamed protein product [Trichobilharzia regenti]